MVSAWQSMPIYSHAHPCDGHDSGMIFDLG